MTAAHVREYHALFPRRPGELAGEWTPRYLRDVWTPRLIQRAAPDARLLVMLRDPVERYRSGVAFQTARAPERPPERIAADAIERSRYGTQVRRLFDLFDPAQVLVLQYERCVLDPLGQHRRTLVHLGVEDHVPADLTGVRGRSTAAVQPPLWPELVDGLRLVFDPEVRLLKELVGEAVDLALWPSASHLG